MSPTIFRIGNYRFYLAAYTGFSEKQLNKLHKLVEKHKNEIVKAWKEHFEA